MHRRKFFLGLAALALLSTASQADAAFSTIGFADVGTPSINSSSLLTATSFTIGDMVSTSNTTGLFAGFPKLTDFGAVTINTSDISALTFGSAALGTFTATSFEFFGASSSGGVESLSIYVLGTFTPGTTTSPAFGGTTPVPASFTVNFGQNGSALNDSATLSVPPAMVPEPASAALLGLGLVGLAGFTLRRRTSN